MQTQKPQKPKPQKPWVDVTLLQHEMQLAGYVAVMRQASNLSDGRIDAHGAQADANGWGLHVIGACGEMAVAKHLNRYWNGALGNLKADDVSSIQVRTRTSHSYDLIVHHSDPDDKIFVLVTGLPPHFRVHGWAFGVFCKDKKFWSDPAGNRPAFFVPKSELLQMSSLPKDLI